MNVVIVDSGISLKQHRYIDKKINVIRKKEGFYIDGNCSDEVGHGTAVTELFLKNIENPEKLNLSFIKVDNNSQMGYDLEQMLFAIDYIDSNIECNVLLISSGIRVYNYEMYSKLYDLYKKGVIIFSAFDNMGSMSYPAAFDFVIGVDITDNIVLNEREFICLFDNPINLIRKNKIYRVSWLDNKINIVKGSSFACGDTVGDFVNYCIKNEYTDYKIGLQNYLTRQAKKVIYCDKLSKKSSMEILGNCKKAVVFPFNKEIHAMASNEDLLIFEVMDYYDIRQSGQVGISVGSVFGGVFNDKKVKNIENIDWANSDFDTFVLGHCLEIEKLLGQDVKKNIINNCKKYNKTLFSFDDIEDYDLSDLKYYHPRVDNLDVPRYNYGKMYISNTPVLGIFGTSSKQGKFTLQLMLRRMFIQNGYNVAQIGTEPSSELFGMDCVFPMGYNSSVLTRSNDNIIILNKYMHECEMKSPDIIIVGSQSGTCPYNIYNLNLFTLPQTEFLLGTQPDVVVLCVNVGDNLEYVNRTIRTIEGMADCKVIAFSVFPRKMSMNIEMISSMSSDREFQKYKIDLYNHFGIPVFPLDESGVPLIYERIIDYLS